MAFGDKLIRLVKEEAIKLELRSKLRTSSKGVTRGGRYFDRGQIHHMLSNPIYAGRIRHKGNVYEGLHAAIIDPDVWDTAGRGPPQPHDVTPATPSGRAQEPFWGTPKSGQLPGQFL